MLPAGPEIARFTPGGDTALELYADEQPVCPLHGCLADAAWVSSVPASKQGICVINSHSGRQLVTLPKMICKDTSNYSPPDYGVGESWGDRQALM